MRRKRQLKKSRKERRHRPPQFRLKMTASQMGRLSSEETFMQKVIRGTKDRKKLQGRQQVVVEKAGHPAAFRKMRCPKCSLGMAVAKPNNDKEFICDRCGLGFTATAM